MATTTIGVQAATRNQLERIKREMHLPNLDAALNLLLQEHHGTRGPNDSARLLLAVARHRRELVRFAQQNEIRYLAAFGSAIHGDARPESDLDLLVEFGPKKAPGLLGLSALQRKLSQILGVTVDLQTPGFLSKPLREDVLAEALPLYVAT